MNGGTETWRERENEVKNQWGMRSVGDCGKGVWEGEE